MGGWCVGREGLRGLEALAWSYWHRQGQDSLVSYFLCQIFSAIILEPHVADYFTQIVDLHRNDDQFLINRCRDCSAYIIPKSDTLHSSNWLRVRAGRRNVFRFNTVPYSKIQVFGVRGMYVWYIRLLPASLPAISCILLVLYCTRFPSDIEIYGTDVSDCRVMECSWMDFVGQIVIVWDDFCVIIRVAVLHDLEMDQWLLYLLACRTHAECWNQAISQNENLLAIKLDPKVVYSWSIIAYVSAVSVLDKIWGRAPRWSGEEMG